MQPQSETVWRQMNKYGVPRVAFVNKMDRTGADYFGAVDDICTKLKGNAHPLFIPIGQGEEFKGMIDLIKNVAYVYDETDPKGMKYNTVDIPENQKEEAKQWRTKLIEALADFDDVLAAKQRTRMIQEIPKLVPGGEAPEVVYDEEVEEEFDLADIMGEDVEGEVTNAERLSRIERELAEEEAEKQKKEDDAAAAAAKKAAKRKKKKKKKAKGSGAHSEL